MTNNWEVLGNFMYPPDAYVRLLALLRAGLLDVRAVRTRIYPLESLPEAMAAAAFAKSDECIVMTCSTEVK
jgi:alcohol dehydrogenase